MQFEKAGNQSMMQSLVSCRIGAWTTRAGVLALAAAPLFAQGGEVAKGEALVESSGCRNCHRINDKGSRMGPNLSGIGDKRTAQQLQRSIVAPDEEVLPENRFVSVVLKDGTTVKGRLLNHDAISVQLIDSKEQLRSFQTSAMRGYTILLKGLMPSFAGKLSDQQVSDIVTYLSSLKEAEQP
jgi:putative heme-binding domain-containing protein